MLTRRTLFARLSAVALAPLVELLPKEEASIRVIGCDVATGLDWSVTQVYIVEGWKPVPQEEA